MAICGLKNFMAEKSGLFFLSRGLIGHFVSGFPFFRETSGFVSAFSLLKGAGFIEGEARVLQVGSAGFCFSFLFIGFEPFDQIVDEHAHFCR